MRHKWRKRIGFGMVYLVVLSIPIVALLNHLMGDNLIACGRPLSRGCESFNYMGGFFFVIAIMMAIVAIKEKRKQKNSEADGGAS